MNNEFLQLIITAPTVEFLKISICLSENRFLNRTFGILFLDNGDFLLLLSFTSVVEGITRSWCVLEMPGATMHWPGLVTAQCSADDSRHLLPVGVDWGGWVEASALCLV